MSSPDPNSVRIRLEIDVPFGARIGNTPHIMQAAPTTPHRMFYSIPSPKPVCPPTGNTVLGSICATVVYEAPCPTNAAALVVPTNLLLSTPPNNKPAAAVAGQMFDGGSRWVWDTTNPVPGADFSDTGVSNTFVVWKSSDNGATWTCDGTQVFTGTTGTAGTCCSGSSNGMMATALKGLVFPSCWMAEVGEMDPPILGRWWALHRLPGGSDQAWGNEADGRFLPVIRLKLVDEKEWELMITGEGYEVSYRLKYRPEDSHGPLTFTGGKSKGKLSGGRLPTIKLSATV